MTITLPSYLEEFKYLIGFDFPEADEDALRRCASAWRIAANELRADLAEAQVLGPVVDAALGGQTGSAFDEVWAQLGRAGGFLDQLGQACEQMANACDHAAEEVEYAKLEFIGALIVLAGVVAYLLSMLFLGGVSAAGIPVAIATAQATVRALLLRLAASVVMAEVFMVGLDGLAQTVQMFAGHRQQWDWTKTANAAEAGLVFGAANGVAFGLAARFAPALLTGFGGQLGVGSAAAFVGLESDALLNGGLPRGHDFLLSLSSSLTLGAIDGAHGRLHSSAAPVRPTLADLHAGNKSTVDGFARLVDASGPSSDPHLAGAADRAHDIDGDGSVRAENGADRRPSADPQVLSSAPDHGATAGPPDRLATGAPVPAEAPTSAAAPGGITSPADVVPTGGAGPAEVTAGPAPGSASGVHASHGVDPNARPSAAPAQPGGRSTSVNGSTHPAGVGDPAAGPRVDPPAFSHPDASLAGPSNGVGGPGGTDAPTPDAPAVAIAGVGPVGMSTSDTHSLPAVPSGLFPPLTDAEARALVVNNAFATDAGLGFYADGDPTREFAGAVEPTEGYVTLDLHGGIDGFYIDGRRITPEQFADALRQLYVDGLLDLPEGVGIKLLSCDTAHGGVTSPAAALARALGVDVIAPDRIVWTSMMGEEIVSSPKPFGGYIIPTYPPDGAWHHFDPSGGEVMLSFDPGYHGPAVDGRRPLSQFAFSEYDTDDPYDRDPYTGNAYDDYRDW